MDIYRVDVNHTQKGYLDEKELLILYWLLRKKSISTLWSNVFKPNIDFTLHAPSNPSEIATLEDDINTSIERHTQNIRTKVQSSSIISYLLELGKTFDARGFSISCNADYSLVEGGFLCNYVADAMYEYLQDTDKGRANKKKYGDLNKEQKNFLQDVVKNGNLDTIKLSRLAKTPIKEYEEAILDRHADEDFIELVNKLITEYDGGKWNTEDVEKFLAIYYRHNKENFKKHALSSGLLTKNDSQTALSKLIFEHIDVRLSIKDTQKLKDYLDKYIAFFIDDELNGPSKSGLTATFFSNGLTLPLYTQFFGFKKQKNILVKYIEGKYEEYQRNDLEIGHPYFEPEYIGDNKNDTVKITIAEKDKLKSLFLFVHTMLALEYTRCLNVEEFSYGTTGLFDLYDRGFLFKVNIDKGTFSEETKQRTGIAFDLDKSRFYVQGKEIKLLKFKDEYHTLRVIFEDPNELSKEWFFSEIGEKIDENNLDDKKYYNAIYQLRLKLEKQGINDFFITTKQSVKISPKYLS